MYLEPQTLFSMALWEVVDWPGLRRPERRGTSQQPHYNSTRERATMEDSLKVVVSKEEDIFPEHAYYWMWVKYVQTTIHFTLVCSVTGFYPAQMTSQIHKIILSPHSLFWYAHFKKKSTGIHAPWKEISTFQNYEQSIWFFFFGKFRVFIIFAWRGALTSININQNCFDCFFLKSIWLPVLFLDLYHMITALGPGIWCDFRKALFN